MKLAEMKLIHLAFTDATKRGAALAILNRDIGALEAKANTKKALWESWAPALGLKKEDLGRIVTLRGTQYQIVGVNPGARKNAIAIMRVHDKREFRCSPHWVRSAA